MEKVQLGFGVGFPMEGKKMDLSEQWRIRFAEGVVGELVGIGDSVVRCMEQRICLKMRH